jgi:hypothetical protein
MTLRSCRGVPSVPLVLALTAMAAACGGSPAGVCTPYLLPPFDPDCEMTADDCRGYVQTASWAVDLHGAELLAGDSRRASVTPGLPDSTCIDLIGSVNWFVADPAVAASAPIGAKNARPEVAADIARAWITGLGPGETTITARVTLTDGSTRDARPGALRVVAAARSPRRQIVVADGTVVISFNQFTNHGSGGPIGFRVPQPGWLDVTLDWPDFSSVLSVDVYGGVCTAFPCQGPRIVNGGRLEYVKPRRAGVPVQGGDYTLAMWGVGSGTIQARYEVRFTPD